MIVTICDYDAIKEPLRFFPNLEVMKLSSYYKSKNHLTYGLFSLKDEVLLKTSSKIILRKDRGNSDIPTEFLDLPRVEYGGMGFTNRHYIALPEEIEHTAPDRFFYEKYLNEARMSENTRATARTVIRFPMMRLSLDGRTCNNNWDTIDLGSPRSTVTIYDADLAKLENSFDIVKSFERPLRLRWPLNVRSVEEALKWSQSLPIIGESVLNLYGYDYNNLRELTPLYDLKHKTYLIIFDHNSDYGTFKKELKQLMKLGIHQKIAGKSKLKVWYQPDNFTKPYERQITHLVDFFNNSFTDISFMENLERRAKRSMPFWEELAREDVELKFLINISPPQWRKIGEQLRL